MEEPRWRLGNCFGFFTNSRPYRRRPTSTEDFEKSSVGVGGADPKTAWKDLAPTRCKEMPLRQFDPLATRDAPTVRDGEAGGGIEPPNRAFAEPCLPTWLPRRWVRNAVRCEGLGRLHSEGGFCKGQKFRAELGWSGWVGFTLGGRGWRSERIMAFFLRAIY
jgi:hypothetical protein